MRGARRPRHLTPPTTRATSIPARQGLDPRLPIWSCCLPAVEDAGPASADVRHALSGRLPPPTACYRSTGSIGAVPRSTSRIRTRALVAGGPTQARSVGGMIPPVAERGDRCRHRLADYVRTRAPPRPAANSPVHDNGPACRLIAGAPARPRRSRTIRLISFARKQLSVGSSAYVRTLATSFGRGRCCTRIATARSAGCSCTSCALDSSVLRPYFHAAIALHQITRSSDSITSRSAACLPRSSTIVLRWRASSITGRSDLTRVSPHVIARDCRRSRRCSTPGPADTLRSRQPSPPQRGDVAVLDHVSSVDMTTLFSRRASGHEPCSTCLPSARPDD